MMHYKIKICFYYHFPIIEKFATNDEMLERMNQLKYYLYNNISLNGSYIKKYKMYYKNGLVCTNGIPNINFILSL